MTPRSWRAVLTLALVATARCAVAAPNLVDFARCLTRTGATFYTAAWCPHCASQERMFGAAFRWIRSVDCTNGCRGVTAFPTWRFGDGSRLSGLATLDVLASRSGCSLTASPGRESTDAEPAGVTERTVGGAKIIEIERGLR
jgi:hypothetical protein